MSFLSEIADSFHHNFFDVFRPDFIADDRNMAKLVSALKENAYEKEGGACGCGYSSSEYSSCYEVDSHLIFGVDCAKPLGERLSIKRFEYYVPFVAGHWDDVGPVLGAYEAYPELGEIEESLCRAR